MDRRFNHLDKLVTFIEIKRAKIRIMESLLIIRIHSTDTELYFKITVKHGYLSSSQWSSSPN